MFLYKSLAVLGRPTVLNQPRNPACSLSWADSRTDSKLVVKMLVQILKINVNKRIGWWFLMFFYVFLINGSHCGIFPSLLIYVTSRNLENSIISNFAYSSTAFLIKLNMIPSSPGHLSFFNHRMTYYKTSSVITRIKFSDSVFFFSLISHFALHTYIYWYKFFQQHNFIIRLGYCSICSFQWKTSFLLTHSLGYADRLYLSWKDHS